MKIYFNLLSSPFTYHSISSNVINNKSRRLLSSISLLSSSHIYYNNIKKHIFYTNNVSHNHSINFNLINKDSFNNNILNQYHSLNVCNL